MSARTVSALVREYTSRTDVRRMANVCGVGAPTASRWARGKDFPKGERFYRLLAFLVNEDRQVEEYLGMDPEVRGLVRLLGTGMTVDELTAGLGYSSPSHLWVIMRGESQMANNTRQRARRLSAEIERVDPVPKEPPDRAASGPPNGTLHEATLLLASHLRAAVPLAQAIEHPDTPESCRDQLREIVGYEEFFNLTNSLHRLGSRKAREVYPVRKD